MAEHDKNTKQEMRQVYKIKIDGKRKPNSEPQKQSLLNYLLKILKNKTQI